MDCHFENIRMFRVNPALPTEYTHYDCLNSGTDSPE